MKTYDVWYKRILEGTMIFGYPNEWGVQTVRAESPLEAALKVARKQKLQKSTFKVYEANSCHPFVVSPTTDYMAL